MYWSNWPSCIGTVLEQEDSRLLVEIETSYSLALDPGRMWFYTNTLDVTEVRVGQVVAVWVPSPTVILNSYPGKTKASKLVIRSNAAASK